MQEISTHMAIQHGVCSEGNLVDATFCRFEQRVYPNTHCSGIGKSKGLQWVLSDATDCSYVQAKEGPLINRSKVE